ncbi:MAG: MotA/TolQ/ExbB proton channel family protein [Deltaproteobacteria bacterium]|jgi:biopolymer transport protein ExbB/TolQ|nr:MotA/TolQ/ExbB proton channel family protein [Deltaproteobacteria bacterium]
MNGNFASIEKMFLNADPVVQGVMILLFIASLITWAIIIEKAIILSHSAKEARLFRAAGEARELDSLDSLPKFARRIVNAGLRAAKIKSSLPESAADYRARVEGAMRLALADSVERLSQRSLFLASVGSTSPFIGLFGTVWGVTHSFVGIAISGETTLAVVAPGIAEALFATAMGLVAAIPAVLGYNVTVGSIKKFRSKTLGAISLFSQRIVLANFEELAASDKGEEYGSR